MSDSEAFIVAVFMIFTILICYIVGGAYIEKKKFIIFHETGIAVSIGFLISLFAYFWEKDFIEQFTFSNDIFFYVLLPPIIFASGFNMRRKKFFQNLGYVLLYGVVGTTISFFIFSFLTYGFSQANLYYKYSYQDQVTEPFQLSLIECMLLCSLLCSSDVIAAVSILKYEEYPKLYSLVFGEGITNDAVSIILFQAIDNLDHQTDESFSF